MLARTRGGVGVAYLLALASLVVALLAGGAAAARAPSSSARLEVNATAVTRGSGGGGALGFSWHSLPRAAVSPGGPGVFLCEQYVCGQDASTSAWAGLFSADATFEQVGAAEREGWSEATPPWLSSYPVKWVPVREAAGGASFEAEGWPLAGAVVALFINGTDYPVLVARSKPVALLEAAAPRHVRLAIGNGKDSVRVRWNARDACESAEVQYGSQPGKYDMSAKVDAKPTTYDRMSMCGPPANSITGFNVPAYFTHAATMGGLTPGARYWYRVGGCGGQWSAEFAFAAPQPAGAQSTLFAAVVADMGETYSDKEVQWHWAEARAQRSTDGAAAATGPALGRRTHVTEALAKHAASGAGPALTLHVGDLSYATGYHSEWDRFMEMIEPLAASAPFAVVEGNHERDYMGQRGGASWTRGDSGGECGIPTEARFPEAEMWYSFEQGPVHFSMINTEVDMTKGSEQYGWLQKDLAGVDRSRTPWLVVAGHRPMYSATPLGYPLTDGPVRDDVVTSDIEALLYAGRVDLALWGHEHNVMASCPLLNSTCMPKSCTLEGCYDAPVHAVIGNAGQDLTHLTPTNPPFVKYAEAMFGYQTLYADAENLVLSMYGDQAFKLHWNISLSKTHGKSELELHARQQSAR
mmetsp:Transcript_29082/g.94958  ORF Transcript_29082/g.94958 Transcript_29082/m.94958 type:complete len:638 (-) Transcript_29082:64-1977(-)|eukprot:CAMPEP_0170162164 /NCGR_PEP_ID=MMETSP0033_2-20121228/76958_1 /TAXON_ID=195969 /ORGANISM="Dolichomastix tenuilepis, Strain CCMP3274" /LENGTH=637 /DNA_ID=CAMNT_0010399787 /DNA_START=31 /DNA_END=1944 /DNA_ORIENTATION=-